MTSKTINLAILLCALWVSVSAQKKPDVGIANVKKIYDQMYTDIPTMGKTTYVNYEVTTRMRSNTKGPTSVTADIKYYSNKNTVWFLSSNVCMYKDQENTFTVIPKRKAIYWAQSAQAQNVDDRLSNSKKMTDSVFKHCSSVSSSTISSNGVNLNVVKLLLDKKWSDFFHVKCLTFYLDEHNSRLLKQVIEYTSARKIESVEYVFKEVNYNYGSIKIDSPVKQLFFGKNQKLNANYSDYKIIDVRNKSKHKKV